MSITTVQTVVDLRAQVAQWRSSGLTVGLVPTMGNLHAGHLDLVGSAVENTDRVITTIFVNPTQFGIGEDLDSYPRTQAADTQQVADAGGHLMFVPSVSEMYPEGFSTRVIVDGLTQVLCGASRPGHFDGVGQIVTKLLNQAGADRAYFGEKDWQQLAVIKRLVRDLDIATEIHGVTTKRDAYGLALSSRNGYLNDAEIDVARKFNLILQKAGYEIGTGGFASDACSKAAKALIAAGFASVDYVECRDAVTLETVEKMGDRPIRIFGAAHIGRARLIDNHPIN